MSEVENIFESSNNIEEENSNKTDSSSQFAKQKRKKQYSKITEDIRQKLIQRILSKEVTIEQAASEFGIKVSTAKVILKIFKKEGRYKKKTTRSQKPLKDRTSCFKNQVITLSKTIQEAQQKCIEAKLFFKSFQKQQTKEKYYNNKNNILSQAVAKYDDGNNLLEQQLLQQQNDAGIFSTMFDSLNSIFTNLNTIYTNFLFQKQDIGLDYNLLGPQILLPNLLALNNQNCYLNTFGLLQDPQQQQQLLILNLLSSIKNEENNIKPQTNIQQS